MTPQKRLFADLQKDYHSDYFSQARIGDIDLKGQCGFQNQRL
jgi:hypothetical protein